MHYPPRSKLLISLLLPAILACGMLSSFANASPGPEPLAYDSPAPAQQPQQTDPDGNSLSLPFVSLVILIVGGMALSIHARRRDAERLKGMRRTDACGKNTQALDGLPLIG
jgi:hypothetical protein